MIFESMLKIGEVQLSLRPLTPGSYAIDLTSSPAGSDSDERLSATALIDPDGLRSNLTPEAYGRALAQVLFADDALR